MHKILVLFCLLLCGFAPAPHFPDPIEVAQKDSGKTFVIKKGQKINVELVIKRYIGLVWVMPDPPQDVLFLKHTEYIDDRIAITETKRLSFMGVHKGKIELKFHKLWWNETTSSTFTETVIIKVIVR